MSNVNLQRARKLEKPSREDMLARAPSVQYFWDTNRELFKAAWAEWEQSNEFNLTEFSETIIDKKLQIAVNEAWNAPLKEEKVRELWQEISPGVFQCQFFDPQGLIKLREYFDNASRAQIPLRPPYGLVLNRFGAMLDSRSEGYLAAPSFQLFYSELMNKYMRPIARLLFPEITGFDTQTFGFSIQYQAGMDTSLRLHTDASSATLNINMNMPGEEFTGSEVGFYDSTTGKVNRVSFKPGVAMIHRGNIAHAAQPITSGERSNLVFWLYGDHGNIPRGPAIKTDFTAEQRWTEVSSKPDKFAPF